MLLVPWKIDVDRVRAVEVKSRLAKCGVGYQGKTLKTKKTMRHDMSDINGSDYFY